MKKILTIAFAGALSCMFASDGAKIFSSQCAACHGKKAELKYMGKVPPLATLKKDDMVKSMEGYKAGTNNKYKTGVLMKGQMAKLSKEDMQAVAEYIVKTFKAK